MSVLKYFRYFLSQIGQATPYFIEITDLISRNLNLNETINNQARTFSFGCDQPVYTNDEYFIDISSVTSELVIEVSDISFFKNGYGVRLRRINIDNAYEENTILSISGNQITFTKPFSFLPLVGQDLELYHYLLINPGDKVAVTENDPTKLICFGQINNQNPSPINWNYDRDEPNLSFSIDAIEEEINGTEVIMRENIPDLVNYSFILNTLLVDPYAASDLGSVTQNKFKLNFPDMGVNGFSVERQMLSQAIGTLTAQTATRSVIGYISEIDPINLLKITRYLEFFNLDGIAPDPGSRFANGITDNDLIYGEAQYLTPDNVIVFVAGEVDFKLKPDVEVITNYLMLTGTTYVETDGNILTRYEDQGNVKQFEYFLPDPCEDIPYIATLIKTDVLAGSTNTLVVISSLASTNMKTGDIVLVKPKMSNIQQVNKTDFRTILLITQDLPNNKASILLDIALDFVPAAYDIFHDVSNHTIFDQNTDPPPKTGVVKKPNRDRQASVQFLPLSEPHEGQIFVCYYSALKSEKAIIKDSNSISKYGLRAKEINLPNDNIFSVDQLYELGTSLIIGEPEFTLIGLSWGYERIKIGLSLSVNLTNLVKKNFICSDNKITDTGGFDENDMNVTKQEFTCTTLKRSTDEIIKSYLRKNSKKATVPGVDKDVNYVPESLTFQEFVNWELLSSNVVPPPVISFTLDPLRPTEITVLWASLIAFGVTLYFIEVSKYADFHILLSDYNNIPVGGSHSTDTIVSGPNIIVGDTYYIRMTALNETTGIRSDDSNVLTVLAGGIITRVEKIVFNSDQSGQWQAYICDPDGNNKINITNDNAIEERKTTYNETLDLFISYILILGRYQIFTRDPITLALTQKTFTLSDKTVPTVSLDGNYGLFRTGNIINIVSTSDWDSIIYSWLPSSYPSGLESAYFQSNTKLIVGETSFPNYEINLYSLDGSIKTLLDNTSLAAFPSANLAYAIYRGAYAGIKQITRYTLPTGPAIQLSNNAFNSESPFFSSDGMKIVVIDNSETSIYTMLNVVNDPGGLIISGFGNLSLSDGWKNIKVLNVDFDYNGLSLAGKGLYTNFSEGSGNSISNLLLPNTPGTKSAPAIWQPGLKGYNSIKYVDNAYISFVNDPDLINGGNGSNGKYTFLLIGKIVGFTGGRQYLITKYDASSLEYVIFIEDNHKISAYFYRGISAGDGHLVTQSVSAAPITAGQNFGIGIALDCQNDTLNYVIDNTDIPYEFRTSYFGSQAPSVAAFPGISTSDMGTAPVILGNAIFDPGSDMNGNQYRVLILPSIALSPSQMKAEIAKFI